VEQQVMSDCVNCGGLVDPGSGWSPQVVGAVVVGYVCEDCEGEA
jgi:hypothetical protein